jgi:2-polyprenyl-3-methyl-5-hydroxy-6-metoxy-1,4-benzoquinol methylase
VPRALNLGAGEGDLDRAIKAFCDELDACDLNPEDIAHARAVNAGEPRIHYAVEDGLALSYRDATFDVVTCIDVIEHVNDPRRLLGEIVRVLKPRGALILSGPHAHFPFIYDPLNFVLRRVAGRKLRIGAYGYGHTWLVEEEELGRWLREAGLEVEETHLLTKAFAAAFEVYWPGLLQRLLKANARNASETRARALRLPAAGEPRAARLTWLLNRADASLFARTHASVGVAVVARKR